MKPLVSVCIPVWNSEQYLDDCLESVFAQDFAGFEVVVVNDSSPGSDSSGRTCRQIVKQAHKRHKKSGCLKVSYIEHSENRGLVECRRTLINAAHGTFILMLDSDDVLKSGAISALWMLQ
ncbi:MAG TPA: glycosyl transferase, partial [Treponema sp.]|nr:glycosyl transferase [Treponema sp.]